MGSKEQSGTIALEINASQQPASRGVQLLTEVLLLALPSHKHTKIVIIFCTRVSITEKLFSDFALLLHLLWLMLLCFSILQSTYIDVANSQLRAQVKVHNVQSLKLSI